MKQLNNFKSIIFVVSFIFWMLFSLINPFITLFQEQSIFNYIYGFNTLFVLGFLVITVIPRSINKKMSLDDLKFKTGSTKKQSGCSTCKRKKK